jgi:glycolate oxidase iron-sulfur subunit
LVTPDEILAEADRCVKCGLCLPHCPTYQLDRDEADSPRGRIALIQGLETGALRSAPALKRHINRCLLCLACETACPSQVRYGWLMDQARESLARRTSFPIRVGRAMALGILSRPVLLAVVATVLRLVQRSGLQRLAPGTNLRRLAQLLPPLQRHRRLRSLYPARGQRLGRIALFTGCVSRVTERNVLEAAVKTLTLLGWEVLIPPDQTCCGAAHQHAGERDKARRQAERNLAAFRDTGFDALLYIATGCGLQLTQYATLLPDSDEASGFARRAQDVSEFLTSRPWPAGASLTPLKTRVALHEPCTQRNSLRTLTSAKRLLERIPGVELTALPGNERCCGAAGTYLVTQPRISNLLGKRKLEGIRQVTPDIIATSNTGCALQLGAQARHADVRVEVVHPVQLIARQLHGEN